MTTKKINLPTDAVKFLSDIMKINNISLEDAIIEWNRRLEIEKFLKIGDIIKIQRKNSNLDAKKGFIGAVLNQCGTGFDLDKSGKFSVYLFEYDGNSFQADLIGRELEPTGESISKEFLLEYIKKIPPHDTMRKELEQTAQEI